MKKIFLADNFRSLNDYNQVLVFLEVHDAVDVSQEYGFDGELNCPFNYQGITGEVCRRPDGEFFYRFA